MRKLTAAATEELKATKVSFKTLLEVASRLIPKIIDGIVKLATTGEVVITDKWLDKYGVVLILRRKGG